MTTSPLVGDAGPHQMEMPLPALDLAGVFLAGVLVLLSQSVAAFAEKNHIFEKTHLFSMRRG